MGTPAPRLPAGPRNPFEIGLLAEGDHFADREREVARMARAFREPGSKLVVFGDRRLGKSSVMWRAAESVRSAGGKVAVASLATATDAVDAAQRVVSAVQKAVGKGWREIVEQIAARLNATIELKPSQEPGALPSVSLSLGVGDRSAGAALLPDVLSAVDAQMQARGTVLGIGLDEFQRFHDWGGEDAEWMLKEAFERHRSLGYVLSGSRRHQIEAMVTRKGRALWKQTDLLEFGPIDSEVLAEWICQRGDATRVRIPLSVADEIVRLAAPRTRDIVQLARAVWERAVRLGEARADDARRALEQLVREQGALYDVIWRSLPVSQQKILRALAAEPELAVTSAGAARRFNLGPKSTAGSALQKLVEEEHLARDGGGRYHFDDPFFRRWVQLNALPDLGLPPPPLTPS